MSNLFDRSCSFLRDPQINFEKECDEISCIITGPNCEDCQAFFRVLYLSSIEDESQIETLIKYYREKIKICLKETHVLLREEELTPQEKNNLIITEEENNLILEKKGRELLESGTRSSLCKLYFLQNYKRIMSNSESKLNLSDVFYLYGESVENERFTHSSLVFKRGEYRFRIYVQEQTYWHPSLEFVSTIIYVHNSVSISIPKKRKESLKVAFELSQETHSSANQLHTTPILCVPTFKEYLIERINLTDQQSCEWKTVIEMEEKVKKIFKDTFSRNSINLLNYQMIWFQSEKILCNLVEWAISSVRQLRDFTFTHLSLTSIKLRDHPLEQMIQREKTFYMLTIPVCLQNYEKSISYLDDDGSSGSSSSGSGSSSSGKSSWNKLYKVIEKKKVKGLSLRNHQKPPDINQFYQSIVSSNSILFLNLSHCNLNDEDIRTLCENLQYSLSLQSLILSNNRITVASIIWFTRLLKNHSIKRFDLSVNNLSPIGTLVSSIISEQKLNNLYLWDTGLSEKDEPALLALIEKTESLQILNLNCNSLSNHFTEKVFKVLKKKENITFQNLQIPNCSNSQNLELKNLMRSKKREEEEEERQTQQQQQQQQQQQPHQPHQQQSQSLPKKEKKKKKKDKLNNNNNNNNNNNLINLINNNHNHFQKK